MTNSLIVSSDTPEGLLPLIWLRPMFDEDVMPDEIENLRKKFLEFGLRRLPDLEHEEIWGFFDENTVHSIWLELNRWDEADVPGYATSRLALPPVRQPSALVDELLSLGFFSCTTHHVAVEGFSCSEKKYAMDDIQHFGIPRKEDLLAWGMRNALKEDAPLTSIKRKL